MVLGKEHAYLPHLVTDHSVAFQDVHAPSSPPYLFLSLDIFIPMIYLFDKYLLKANYMPSSFVGMQKVDKVLLLVKFSSADEYLISN